MVADMGHYSLWLIPSGTEKRRLAEVIERLSRDPGGPRFEPHLTLLGGLDGEEEFFSRATERLAASLRPITLHPRAVEFGDEYYRCLYLRVEQSDQLMAAHREAVRQFGKKEETSFMPHVSLFYGTLPRDARTQIAKTLDAWRAVDCQTDRLRLVATGGELPSWRIARDCALSAAPRSG
jgi:2'-5' RNA ligase